MGMNRRTFLQAAGSTLASATLTTTSPRTRRQVIVILGEAIRYDMLNCNKVTGLQTPHLDRLAAEGICFDRAYNCQPVCSPARSAIWTGLPPHSNGIVGNSIPLGATEHTIGERLNRDGVRCAFIGKWHLSGTDYFDTGKTAAGWDPVYWYDMRNYLNELTPKDRQRSRKPTTGNDPTWTRELCYAHRVTNRAVDYLSQHKGADFLLCVSFDEPHGPSLCPKEYSDMYDSFVFPASNNELDDLHNKPAHQQVWAGTSMQGNPRPIKSKHFFGSHTFVDDEIGRILKQIELTCPDALVIYTADHGMFLSSHRLQAKGPAMYDEITHVPFVVRWPKHATPGSRSKSLVSHVDISGTLMRYFGYDIPATMRSQDLLPLFKDPEAKARDQVFIEWTRYEVDHDGMGGFQPIRCVCDGRYKLVINLMVTDELYDLQEDPGEMNNLIESPAHTQVRNSLHDVLLNEMNVSRDPLRGYYWGHRHWRPEFPLNWGNSGMTRQRESDGYLPRELDYDTGLVMTSATRSKNE